MSVENSSIEKAVQYWKKALKEKFVPSERGKFKGYHAGMIDYLFEKADITVPESSIEIFGENLREILTKIREDDGKSFLRLDVDYQPCDILFDALKNADGHELSDGMIERFTFPIKTFMTIDFENDRVRVWGGEGTESIEL